MEQLLTRRIAAKNLYSWISKLPLVSSDVPDIRPLIPGIRPDIKFSLRPYRYLRPVFRYLTHYPLRYPVSGRLSNSASDSIYGFPLAFQRWPDIQFCIQHVVSFRYQIQHLTGYQINYSAGYPAYRI